MADVDIASDEVSANEVPLVANTVKTVGFARDLSEVKVANFVGTTTVYVHMVDPNRPRAAAVPPNGKHCYPVFASSTATLPVRTNGNTLVSLISTGATTVWVTAT
jgi:hypothetical protein